MELRAWFKRNGFIVSVFVALIIVAAVLVVESGSRVLAANRSDDEREVDEQVFVLSSGDAWLGVRLADVTPEKVGELKLREEAGALVMQVEDGSPAAKAGLKANDVIIEYQGQRVESAKQLERMVRETPTARTVRLEVIRGGQRQPLTAKLERREWPRAGIHVPPIRVPAIRVPEFNIEVFGSRPRLGISADELTPQLAEFFGVKQGKGVLVREVREGSSAAKAGLKAGDVIVKVDDATVEDVNDLRRALAKKRGGETVALTVVRQKAEQTVKVQLEESRQSSPRRTVTSELNPDELLRDYRESMEHLQPELQELKESLQRDFAEKQRTLQQDLMRLRQELRDHLTL